jgi:hypothetical protein
MKIVSLIVLALALSIPSVPSFAGTKINCKGTMTDYERHNCERNNSREKTYSQDKKSKG